MNLSQPYLRRGPRICRRHKLRRGPRTNGSCFLSTLGAIPTPRFLPAQAISLLLLRFRSRRLKTWLLSAPHGDNSATLPFRHRPVLLARPSNFRIRRPRFDQYLSQRLVRLHGRVSACKGCRSEACAGCFTSGSRHVVFVRAKFGGVFDRDAGGIRALVITCAF